MCDCVCVSSSIMYFPERIAAGEMHAATRRLEGVIFVRFAQYVECYDDNCIVFMLSIHDSHYI